MDRRGLAAEWKPNPLHLILQRSAFGFPEVRACFPSQVNCFYHMWYRLDSMCSVHRPAEAEHRKDAARRLNWCEARRPLGSPLIIAHHINPGKWNAASAQMIWVSLPPQTWGASPQLAARTIRLTILAADGPLPINQQVPATELGSWPETRSSFLSASVSCVCVPLLPRCLDGKSYDDVW